MVVDVRRKPSANARYLVRSTEGKLVEYPSRQNALADARRRETDGHTGIEVINMASLNLVKLDSKWGGDRGYRPKPREPGSKMVAFSLHESDQELIEAWQKKHHVRGSAEAVRQMIRKADGARTTGFAPTGSSWRYITRLYPSDREIIANWQNKWGCPTLSIALSDMLIAASELDS